MDSTDNRALKDIALTKTASAAKREAAVPSRRLVPSSGGEVEERQHG
jgi:hypothetical protein